MEDSMAHLQRSSVSQNAPVRNSSEDEYSGAPEKGRGKFPDGWGEPVEMLTRKRFDHSLRYGLPCSYSASRTRAFSKASGFAPPSSSVRFCQRIASLNSPHSAQAAARASSALVS